MKKSRGPRLRSSSAKKNIGHQCIKQKEHLASNLTCSPFACPCSLLLALYVANLPTTRSVVQNEAMSLR